MSAKELKLVVAGSEPANDRDAQADAKETLLRAAEQAVSSGVELDAFMTSAYAAYLQANPTVRERIESNHLMAQIDELRRRGALASA